VGLLVPVVGGTIAEGGDMKKSVVSIVTILIAGILATSGTAQADSPDTKMMRSLFGGYNIYAPNVMWDDQEMVYKMWYGGVCRRCKGR